MRRIQVLQPLQVADGQLLQLVVGQLEPPQALRQRGELREPVAAEPQRLRRGQVQLREPVLGAVEL